MTVPIGELQAYLSADVGDLHQGLRSLEAGLEAAAQSMKKATSALSGLESFSGQFEATLRSLSQETVAVAGPIDDLERRTMELTNAWRAGILGEQEFAVGLKQLKADIAETAAATGRSAQEMGRLAAIGSEVNGSLRQVTMHARRTAGGFEGMGVAALAASQIATRGIGGVAAAAGSLQVFALGNPVMIGILSGLAALATAWEIISSRSRDAKTAQDNLRESLLQTRQEGAWLTHSEALANAVRLYEKFEAERGRMTEMERARWRAILGLAQETVRITGLATRARVGEHGPSGATGATGGAGAGGGAGVEPGKGATDRATEVAMAVEAVRQVTAAIAAGYAAIGQARDAALSGPGLSLADALKIDMAGVQKFGEVMIDVANAIGDGIMAIGVAIGNGFKSIGGVILGVIGSLLSNVGRSLIAFGVAGLAIKQFIKNPLAAIAAGVAMAALGAALGAAATRSVDGAGTSLAGGGTSGGGGSVGGGSSSSSSPGGAQSGSLSLYINALPDSSDPRQVDAWVEMLRAARDRRMINIVFTDGTTRSV